MRTALYVPTSHDYADPERLIALAQAAEAVGFDGFFIWDTLVFAPGGQTPLVDATVMLGALAQATRQIRLGAMVTPLSRRRPWKFAKELATLDHLSHGRIVCGVGLGEPAATDFAPFGEDASPLGRARRLDEGLAILDPLLRGDAVNHDGNYYQLRDARLAPACLQSPRPPIWVAAALPAQAGLRRAARWDGCFPIKFPATALGSATQIDWSEWWLSPQEFAGGVELIRRLRVDLESPFEHVASGRTIYHQDDPAETLASYAAAGATWWFEWVMDEPGTFERTLEAVRRGPPRMTLLTPTQTQELHQAVRTLHAEIDKAARGDQQSLAELQRLIVSVEHELASASVASPSLASGLRGLRAQIARLEFAHPRATAILNDISMTLSNLGI